MMFTIGNIITLVIVAVFLIIYRVTDKNYRSLDKVKKFADKCKDDIAVFVEEKGMAIKNFGIDLEVEKKAASQLMKNIQQVTEEELAKKAEAIARIDGHIKAFESSLDELFGMTDRVQENLNRIRDESAFIESAHKKLSETKEKLDQVERALEAAGRNLHETEERLEKKNAEILEHTAGEVTASAKAYVSDFEATALVIERKIEEHREAVIKIEREREAVLNHDMEQAKKLLKDVLENAGKRADKLEDAALVKLREQAHERVNHIKTFFEEKIKTTQDTLKNEQGSISEKIKTLHDKCNAEIHEINTRYKHTHQEWTKESAELDNMAKKQKEEIISSINELRAKSQTTIKQEHDDLFLTLNEIRKKVKSAVTQQQNEIDGALKDLKEKTESAVTQQQNDIDRGLKALREKTESAVTQQHNEIDRTLKDIREKTESAVTQQQNDIDGTLKDIREKSNTALAAQNQDLSEALNKQMEAWKLLCRDTEQTIVAANDKRIDEYSKTHEESVKQLASLADDAAKLESELRLSMQEAIKRVKNDFSVFEKESGVSMESTAAAFDSQAKVLREEIEEMNSELDAIRKQAYDNASEKLTAFESDFTAELGKRASEMGRQIADWQTGIQERFANSEGKIMLDWQLAEERITSEQRNSISAMVGSLTSDMERLKQEASAFEMGIREEMRIADEDRSLFKHQLKLDLEEARVSAENEVNTQIGQYQITMQETLRQKQRELEKDLENISHHCGKEYSSLEDTARNTRQSLDDWQSQYMARMREMDAALEKLGKYSRDIAAENDDHFSQFRSSLDDIRKELGAQKKIFEQTEELKLEQDRRIEETNANLNRLEQRKNEIAQLENQLNHVKRLEDEVNNKMTRFLSENRRIELMEEAFNRLLKTSAAVEEKLRSVTSSNDILQAEQVKIRKLEEAMKETEDKYLRIEKKNDVLEETTEGIDRNFKLLQKTETSIRSAENFIVSISGQFDKLSAAIEDMAGQNEKAVNAIDKITILEESLVQIEKRITDMNVARDWLANIETRLNALYKDTKEYVKLGKSLFERESGKKQANEGAPPPQDRDNIRRLWEQGWKVEEIANTMNRSIGEIELTLEIITRG